VITRPLELAARLRPAPRSFDALFYVNAGLAALFFTLFGSRFVLSPGLGVDFQLPRLSGAVARASLTTSYLSVKRSGQIVTESGLLDLGQLGGWLKAQAARDREPSLLIRASAGVTLDDLMKIQTEAIDAGFVAVAWAAEDDRPRASTDGPSRK